MDKINQVAVLGAGAMGAYFAATFFDTPDIYTTLVADGERYERLTRNGLVVNGRGYRVPVHRPEDGPAPVDLVIVALKHHHLEEALPALDPLVGGHTVLLSVMNGLDSEAVIGARFGMDKLLYAISVGIDALRQGNRVTFTKTGTHFFGEASNLEITPRVRAVQEAFDQAGIIYETPADMIRMIWWKFMVNVGANQASAVMRAPYGVFQTSSEAQGLMVALMEEVIALAEAAGVNLRHKDIAEWNAFLNTLSPQGKTSMLQDIEAGRKTEVEIFGGRVVTLGKEYGIPTPVNETVLRIIRVLEENRN
jgi:2-dehydropantoate 2-reductase